MLFSPKIDVSIVINLWEAALRYISYLALKRCIYLHSTTIIAEHLYAN